jgi:nicotinic acid mononucleotide adenylyltransferase
MRRDAVEAGAAPVAVSRRLAEALEMDDAQADPTRERPTLEPLGSGPRGDRPIALLAGSFDPPTVAHVALAAAWRAETRGDVVLVYADHTLPKEPGAEEPLLDDAARLEALRRLADVHAGFHVARTSHGLIVDQAEAARGRWPGAPITVLMGSDKARQLFEPGWYADRDEALDRLFAAADVRYAERAGDEGRVASIVAEPANARFRGHLAAMSVPGEIAAVASSEVRRRIRAGVPVAELVPPEVIPLLET